MSQDNPILNKPYEEPQLHYRTLPDGSLDYEQIIKGRRQYDRSINTLIQKAIKNEINAYLATIRNKATTSV
jgi:hypothetical protein